MPQSPLRDVVAHWHKLIENLSTSSKDFYTDVEESLKARRIPHLKCSRVKFSEGGILQADREYLRVSGDRHTFEMCAAPFGSGYFFSSWVTKNKARFVALYLVLFALLAAVFYAMIRWVATSVFHISSDSMYGPILYGVLGFLVSPIVLVPVSIFAVLWFIAVAAWAGHCGPEAALLTVPLIGWIYERVFARETYYRIDTMLMFQAAVQSAMMEAINGVLTSNGRRALSADDGKPMFRELLFGGTAIGPDPASPSAPDGSTPEQARPRTPELAGV